MKPFLRRTLLATVILAAGFGIYKWTAQRTASAQASSAAAEGAKGVTQTLELAPSDMVVVQTLTLSQGLPVSGTLKAVNTAMVKARVVGELLDLRLREGDRVQQGQVVARIDPTEYLARQRQAQRQVDAAMAQVEVAQKQFDNNQALVDQGFISKTALDTSLFNLNGAKATHLAAVAALDVARKSVDDSVLKAPISGLIAQRLAQPGERVALDARIVEIVDLSQFEVEAAVPPGEAAALHVGQSASLTLEGSATGVKAQVLRINPSAQAGSRSVLIYLGVHNPALSRQADTPQSDTRQAELRQGLFVQGQLATTTLSALAVPVSAVRTDKPQPYVQWIDNGQVRHMTVRLGARGQVNEQDMVAVTGVGAALAEGTSLLSANSGAVREGTRVKFTAVKP
jgi:RND family efflux transporter MFP subunit